MCNVQKLNIRASAHELTCVCYCCVQVPEARGLEGAWEEASGPMMGAQGLDDQWHMAHGHQGQSLEEAWAQGAQEAVGDLAHDEVSEGRALPCGLGCT